MQQIREAEENHVVLWQDVNLEQESKSQGAQLFKQENVQRNLFEMNPEAEQMDQVFNGWTLLQQEGKVWATEPNRNGEFTWSQMTPEEAKQFEASDLQEWASLEKEFKAMKVWRGA